MRSRSLLYELFASRMGQEVPCQVYGEIWRVNWVNMNAEVNSVNSVNSEANWDEVNEVRWDLWILSWSSSKFQVLQVASSKVQCSLASFKVVQVRVENHTAIDLLVRRAETPRLDRDLIETWSRYKITLWLCQNSYWKWPFIVDLHGFTH